MLILQISAGTKGESDARCPRGALASKAFSILQDQVPTLRRHVPNLMKWTGGMGAKTQAIFSGFS